MKKEQKEKEKKKANKYKLKKVMAISIGLKMLLSFKVECYFTWTFIDGKTMLHFGTFFVSVGFCTFLYTTESTLPSLRSK